MNCPECGAWTTINETRLTVMRYRRRRECGNGHKFTTEEVVVPQKQIEQEVKIRLKTAKANKAIAKKYQPPKEYSL